LIPIVAIHPLKAINYWRGKRESFGLVVASSYATHTVTQRQKSVPLVGVERTVNELRDLLITRGKNWPQWDASGAVAMKGPLLYLLARLAKPRRIVETGVASGVTTAFLLQALHDNRDGNLISIDLPNADPGAIIPPGRRIGWIIPEFLQDRWDLRIGDAKELLPATLAEGPIDMFLHDSLHTYEHMAWEYNQAWRALVEGGLLLSDDIAFNSAFRDFCARTRCHSHRVLGLGVAVKEPGWRA
jgi:predicted O-methyltransferase YrrM